MTSVKDYEHLLIARFVASFEKLDELTATEGIYPIAWQLAVGDPDEYGQKRWRPIKVISKAENLEPIYSNLPARFPRLYEQLVLSYRWADVDLQSFTLLANPPGTDLGGLLHEISKDKALWNCLRKAGYVQFGKGPDLDYDPVCFDMSSRKNKGRDSRIVKIDHEQILCHDRVKIVGELAPSFEKLVLATIEKAGIY
ncbi:MAG: hypothetical protein LAO08_20830 [Acidobacteriia bacterium]|nr:hypothetical protein [Terriglobia bacterium]